MIALTCGIIAHLVSSGPWFQAHACLHALAVMPIMAQESLSDKGLAGLPHAENPR